MSADPPPSIPSSSRSSSGARRPPPGATPGELETSAEEAPTLRFLAYGPDGFNETIAESLSDFTPNGPWPVTWIDVDGPPDLRLLAQLRDVLGVHPLALEDVIDQGQRPKVEGYLDQHFMVVHMLSYHERLEIEQLSLFLSERCVVTFQGREPSDSLEPVRERIRQGKGRIRQQGTDYLIYALLDSVVDHYFPIVDKLGDKLAELEAAVLVADSPDVIGRVQALKRDLLQFRRLLWPLAEALTSLGRSKDPLLCKETRLFLRDCSDHVDQLKDLLEVYRETAETLVETYLSVLSNRTNDTMRFLTLVTTIFIPLTFLVGIYGMNFDPDASPYNMPELRWRYGYPAVLVVMLLVALGMFRWFVHRRWFR
jgi:magnesium transporter